MSNIIIESLSSEGTFNTALIYDLFSKKWGKIQFQDGNLGCIANIERNSISDASAGELNPRNYPFEALAIGPDGGALFSVFGGVNDPTMITPVATEPSNQTKVKYGKLGLYRLGFTRFHELRFKWAKVDLPISTDNSFDIVIEISIDGNSIDRTEFYPLDVAAAVLPTIQPIDITARWINIIIESANPLQLIGLEVLAEPAGRR